MYFKVYVLLSHFSHVQLFVTACVHRILQVKILEWLSFPPPGNLPNPLLKPRLLWLLHYKEDFLPLSHLVSPYFKVYI